MGERHLKLVVGVPGTDTWIDAIAFNVDPEVWPNPQVTQLDLAYRLDVNEYRGNQTVQLVVEHLAIP